ncbi:unnamed protein product (macronuclear) [Paramecium tetraurelia]|uniref:Uncharacterized protein n=1 Tax=Paramecium tetraurelia TaxID=5888 RepID=A0BAT7_PARTE|nr:uncharacterized protein GSPATT00000089001 [Paramecium tetraurelia]CAK55654.1 unnamed protein product [Paramecium tetraurelia]|eukprot:XP_001423052.1 hypothetical protein (macronuclear) [Paramecium tetraurelia strain d4-2]
MKVTTFNIHTFRMIIEESQIMELVIQLEHQFMESTFSPKFSFSLRKFYISCYQSLFQMQINIPTLQKLSNQIRNFRVLYCILIF